MGDKKTLAKARQELEDLYLGVPDESVDLTLRDMRGFQQNDVEERNLSFKNMANVQQNGIAERKIANMEPIHEDSREDLNNLTKSPSLDFSKALQATKARDRHTVEDELYREHLARNNVKRNGNGLRPHAVESSPVYDDANVFSTVSRLEEKGGRKRPGIPHSNICALCSEYIYFCRHRCLVRSLRSNLNPFSCSCFIPVFAWYSKCGS